jgi:endonuclease/exonuclease/phosphatase family metal-dependent hydrolase
MAKKSRIRKTGKTVLIFLNVLASLLLVYPIYIKPLSFIWINGFLGLITPYLIIVEILFLIIWFIAKPIRSFISLLALGFSYKAIIVLFAVHPGSNFGNKRKDNQLRILSWNVKGFNGLETNSTLKLRTEDIAYSIQKWNPDIICLQEYNTNERAGDVANHATYFNAKYPYSFFSKDYQTFQKDYYAGCIIYSKYKIIKAERIPFLNQESLLSATIVKGDDTLNIFTTHLASYRFKQNDFDAIDDATKNKWSVIRKMKHAFTERAVQAQIVRAALDKSVYPSIITGDFNDVPNSYTYDYIKSNWQDAFLEKGVGIGATFSGLSPILRIDYILPNAQWEVKAWESIDENLSDHHMIMADLLLKK